MFHKLDKEKIENNPKISNQTPTRLQDKTISILSKQEKWLRQFFQARQILDELLK
jgi:hypothetical protein